MERRWDSSGIQPEYERKHLYAQAGGDTNEMCGLWQSNTDQMSQQNLWTGSETDSRWVERKEGHQRIQKVKTLVGIHFVLGSACVYFKENLSYDDEIYKQFCNISMRKKVFSRDCNQSIMIDDIKRLSI